MNSPKEFIEPDNFGIPTKFTMLALPETVIKSADSKFKVIFKPLPSDDLKQRKQDNTLAKNHLQWEPTVPLESELQETIAYFKRTIEKP